MSELPDPLVPSDVDLRGLDYMPFFGNHLFGSEFNARCSDAEWRAGVTLWWAAWNQQPAGSLPNDDTALCRLADLGRDLKLWRKIKSNALRGFVLCTDSRLYHGFLCRQVMVAWEKRVQERERKRKWREKKQGQDAVGDGDKGGTKAGQDADVPADGNGRDVTGRDGTERASTAPAAPRTRKRPIPPDFTISAAVSNWAGENGYTSLESHLEAFRNKAYARGYQYVDWDRAFMEAIRANWAKVEKANGKPKDTTCQRVLPGTSEPCGMPGTPHPVYGYSCEGCNRKEHEARQHHEMPAAVRERLHSDGLLRKATA